MAPSFSKSIPITLLVLITLLSFAGTWGVWIGNAGFAAFNDAMALNTLPDGLDVGLSYTGNKFLDGNLQRFVFMIMPVVTRRSKQAVWGQPLFSLSVVDLGAMFLVMLLEAERRGRRMGNRGKQSLWIFFWLAAAANISLAVMAPIYSMANLSSLAILSPQRTHPTKPGTIASFLAVLACVAVPGVLLLDPWQHGVAFQSTWLAALGAFPLSIAVVKETLMVFGWPFRYSVPKTSRFTKNILYVAAIVASLTRAAAMLSIILDSRTTLAEVFIPSMDEVRGVPGYSSTCLTFMKFDYALSAATELVVAWAVLVARFPSSDVLLAISVTVAFALFGAGGVLLFVWAWREDWAIGGVQS